MKALCIIAIGFYLYRLYLQQQAAKACRNDRKRFYDLYKINI